MAISQTRYSFPSIGDAVRLHFDPIQKPSGNTFQSSVSKEYRNGIVGSSVSDDPSKKTYKIGAPGMIVMHGALATSEDAFLNPLVQEGSLYTCFGSIYEGYQLIAYFAVDYVNVVVQSVVTDKISSCSFNISTKTLTTYWFTNPSSSTIGRVGYSYSQVSVEIYKYTGKKRNTISNYDTNLKIWNKNIPFDQFMLSIGYSYIDSVLPTDSEEDNHSYSIEIDSSDSKYSPGLYADVWFLSSDSEEDVGPFIQNFRLDSRTLGAGPVPSRAWYDLKVFPEGIPFPSSPSGDFPMVVGVIPLYKNVSNSVDFLSFKSFLSGIYVELTEIYFVEDEALGQLDPEVLVWSGSNVFGDQVSNFFHGSVDSSIFDDAGVYSFHFRVKSVEQSSIPEDGYRDFWKTVVVSRAKNPSVGEPPSICFPNNGDGGGVRPLCSMVVSYDGNYTNIGLVVESSASLTHEPREEEVFSTVGQNAPSSVYVPVVSFSDEPGNLWDTVYDSNGSIDPIVVIDREVLIPERKINKVVESGPGYYDFSSSRSIVFDDSISSTSHRFALIESKVKYPYSLYLGSVVGTTLNSEDANSDASFYSWDAPYASGNRYFNLFFVIETNDGVVSPVRYGIRQHEIVFFKDQILIQKDVIDSLIPEVMGSRSFKIAAHYSVGVRTSNTTAERIACDKFEADVPVMKLSRKTDLDRFPVIAFYGNLPLAIRHDYNVLNGNAIEPLYTPVPGNRLTVYYGARS
jgi:hypothetical protein